jgi:hypothetical protein
MDNDWNEMLRRVKACRATAKPALMAEIKLTDGTILQAKGAGQNVLDDMDKAIVLMAHLNRDFQAYGNPNVLK